MQRSAVTPRAYGAYAGGTSLPPSGGAALPVVDPTTGETWATIDDGDAATVDRAVAAARAAYERVWSRTTPRARAALLLALADAIERHAAELAELEVRDNGKLLREMSAQIGTLPAWYRYYAGIADKLHGETIPTERASLFTYTVREPFGVVACITPWNSPLFLLAFALAPALAAGNTVVVKPSEHASVSTLEFVRCVEEAGFPPGVVNVVTGRGATAGDALARHPGVARVCFTGGGAAGGAVAAAAASHAAYATLELGGKSPSIVFADADLDAAVAGLLAGIFAAAGQTCVAGSRALVERAVYDEVLARLLDRARAIRLGDPLDAATEMGPLANEPQLRRVCSYLGVAGDDGAHVACGGRRPDGAAFARGLFFEPTILTQVRPAMRIAREEIFGPVLAVMPFDGEDEAIALANDTEYGLAAGIWTRDLRRALRMTRCVRAGSVWVNTYRAFAPSMPFGGYGASGVGRQNGADALRDFTELKSVWIETEPLARDPFTIAIEA